MDGLEHTNAWEDLAQIIETGTAEQAAEFFTHLPSGQAALVVSRLTEEQQKRLFSRLDPEDAAALFGQMIDAQAIDVLEHLEPTAAAAILDELPSYEQADLIGELDDAEAEAILRQMDPAEAADARSLIDYDDDVAGGLMMTEFLRYQEQVTVGDVIDDMRHNAEAYRDYDVQYAYVCDSTDLLTGVLRLRDLLLARRNQPVENLMIRNPACVPVDASLDELADFFDQHGFLGVPVVDAEGRLVGVVRRFAVAEAWGERQDSTFLKTQGIVGGEEIRSMPVLRRSSRRLAWLSVNIVLNIIAASIIALYQETLSSVIALAVFLPIISDMSGCSGNQAVAVSMRELSLGLIRPNELLRVWLKEIGVGLINGTLLGLMIAMVAYAWKGSVYLGLVVGLALGLNTLVAVSLGGLVPLILQRFRLDPAIASGPILTTFTDMCGFFLVLGIATMLLSHLL